MAVETPTCCGCYVQSLYEFRSDIPYHGGPYDHIPWLTPSVATLTLEEQVILSLLRDAWNKFLELEEKHPSDNQEFLTAIHDAQKIVGMRVARRIDPDIWVQPEKKA